MRLWSIHPKYLDSKGLVSCWRESLLAQKVLLGETKGYKNHTQLIRFKNDLNPIRSISSYLRYIHKESIERNYSFDESKIFNNEEFFCVKHHMAVTNKQIEYEAEHLIKKLYNRNDRDRYALLNDDWINNKIEIHPLFYKIKGDIESWEKIIT